MPAVTPAESGGERARVLIADDNADMREYLTNLLQTSGYEVSAVADGQQALEAIRSHVPDLVISDVMMPRLDGLQLLAALRNDPRTAPCPFCCCLPAQDRKPPSKACWPAPTTTSSNPSPPRSFSPGYAPMSSWRGCATIKPAGGPPWWTRLQEAFFVCDERGAVIEINTAFTEILGYGPEGLPYEPVHPWWPDVDAEPEAHRQVETAFGQLLDQTHGAFTVPVTHRRRASGVGRCQLQPCRRSRLGAPSHGRHLARRHSRALHRAAPDCAGFAQSATGSSRYAG